MTDGEVNSRWREQKLYWELSNTLNNQNFWCYVAATAWEVFFIIKEHFETCDQLSKKQKNCEEKLQQLPSKNITSKSFVAIRSNLKKSLLFQVAQNTLPRPQRLPSQQPRTRRTCSAWQHSGPPWGPRPRPDHWGPRCSSRPKTGLASSLASQESKITFLLQNF